MSIEATNALVEALEASSGLPVPTSREYAGRIERQLAARGYRVAPIEEGQEEMGVWGAENPQRNAERRADRRERERQARTEDLNASAHPNRVTLDELRRQGRG